MLSTPAPVKPFRTLKSASPAIHLPTRNSNDFDELFARRVNVRLQTDRRVKPQGDAPDARAVLSRLNIFALGLVAMGLFYGAYGTLSTDLLARVQAVLGTLEGALR